MTTPTTDVFRTSAHDEALVSVQTARSSDPFAG
jgi:hypothetical protein